MRTIVGADSLYSRKDEMLQHYYCELKGPKRDIGFKGGYTGGGSTKSKTEVVKGRGSVSRTRDRGNFQEGIKEDRKEENADGFAGTLRSVPH